MLYLQYLMSPVFFCMKRPFIESHQMGSPFLKVEMKTPTADVIEWLMKNLFTVLCHRHGIIFTYIKVLPAHGSYDSVMT